jgi:hypothetical protein
MVVGGRPSPRTDESDLGVCPHAVALAFSLQHFWFPRCLLADESAVSARSDWRP